MIIDQKKGAPLERRLASFGSVEACKNNNRHARQMATKGKKKGIAMTGLVLSSTRPSARNNLIMFWRWNKPVDLAGLS